MLQGAHFFSDVVFAGLTVWLGCCLLRWCWLHVRLWRRRPSNLPRGLQQHVRSG
jgi:membrane-associated phospholipid phosphatase